MSGVEAVSGQTALLERIARWLERWFEGPGREIDRLPADEVARVAHDIGISQHDLETLAHRGDEPALLLYHRLKALGIDPAVLAKEGFMRDLQRTCSLCVSKETCSHDLVERPDGEEWVGYCPNSTVLKDVQSAS